MPDNTPDTTVVTPDPAAPSVQVPTQDASPSSDQIAAPAWTADAASAMGGTDNGQPSVPTPVASTVTQVQRPPDALQSHPAVVQSSILHRVAETLAGGPKVQTTYNDDGSVTRTKVPLTSKQILMGAVANLLGGFGDVSQNLSARMKGQQAPNQNPQLATQAAAQKQAMESEEDYNSRQNAIVRAVKVREANLTNMQLAFALGKESDQAKDSEIALHASDLKNYTDAGAVSDSHIPSDQLMARSYSPSKYVAIPDGKTPAIGPDGKQATNSEGVPLSQLTYSVVNATGQTPLTQQDYDNYRAAGLMKGPDDFKVPEGASVSVAAKALLSYKLGLLDQTQREIDRITGPDNKVNVTAAVKANPGLLSAISAFHNDASSTDINEQISNLRAKNPQAAGLMTNLIGADNLKRAAGSDFKNIDDARKKLADDLTNVKVNGDGTVTYSGKDSSVQDAANYLNFAVKQETGQKAGQKKAENAVDNSGAPAKNSGLVGEAFLQTLAAPMATTVRAIGEGRQEITTLPRGKERQKYIDALNQAYPGFDESKVKSYIAARKDFTSGKTSQGINAINTALGHLNEVNDNIGYLSTLPGISYFDRKMGGQAATLNTARNLVSDEIGKAYKAGVVTEGERDQYMKLLDSGSAPELKANVKELATLLNGKFDALQNQWSNAMPSGVVLPIQLVTPKAAAAYEKITGQKLQNLTSAPSPSTESGQAQPGAQPQATHVYDPSTGTVKPVGGQ